MIIKLKLSKISTHNTSIKKPSQSARKKHPGLVDEVQTETDTTCLLRELDPLHSCAPLQVLFDLRRVFAVETLRLLVEFGIPLVDVVDVCIVVVGPASAVLGSFLNPASAKESI